MCLQERCVNPFLLHPHFFNEESRKINYRSEWDFQILTVYISQSINVQFKIILIRWISMKLFKELFIESKHVNIWPMAYINTGKSWPLWTLTFALYLTMQVWIILSLVQVQKALICLWYQNKRRMNFKIKPVKEEQLP